MKKISTLLLLLFAVSAFAADVNKELLNKAERISRDIYWNRKKGISSAEKKLLVRAADEMLKSLPVKPGRRDEETVKEAYYYCYLAGDRDKCLKICEKYHKTYEDTIKFVYLMELNRRKEYDKMYELGMSYVNSYAVYEQAFFTLACLLGCNDNKVRQNEYIKNLDKLRIYLRDVYYNGRSLAERARFKHSPKMKNYCQNAIMEAFKKFTFPPKQQAELRKVFSSRDYTRLSYCKSKEEFSKQAEAFLKTYPEQRKDYIYWIAGKYVSFAMYKEAEALYREKLASAKEMHVYSGLFVTLYLSKQYEKLLEEAIPVFNMKSSANFTTRFGDKIVQSAIKIKKLDIAKEYAKKTYKRAVDILEDVYDDKKDRIESRREKATSDSSKKRYERELKELEMAKINTLLNYEANYRKALCDIYKLKGDTEEAIEALDDWEKNSFELIADHKDFDKKKISEVKHEIFAAKIKLMIELKKFADAERILAQFEKVPSKPYWRQMKLKLKKELREAKRKALREARRKARQRARQ